MALGEAVDKQDRFPVGLAVFMHGELEATTTGHRVYGHVSSPTTLGCVIATSNAGPQPRLEAEAERTLEGVGCRPLLCGGSLC